MIATIDSTPQTTGAGFEWILLLFGVALTLFVIGFFAFVLTRKDDH